MSEREFEDFFLTAWVDTAKVKVAGTKTPLTGAPLLEILRAGSEYRALFGKLVKRGVPGPILSELLRTKFRGTKRGVGHPEIGEAIVAAAATVNGYTIQVQAGDNGDPHRVTIAGPPTVTFSTDVFKSADYATLLELWEKIAAAAKGPTTLIDEAERETQVKGVDGLLHAALDRSRQGASFQRYKGLGEMNPEQLWETTMNPETRTLLKVTMEDAVGAERAAGPGPDRRRDAEVVPGLRDVRHRRARAPRHPRRAQARPPPGPVHDAHPRARLEPGL